MFIRCLLPAIIFCFFKEIYPCALSYSSIDYEGVPLDQKLTQIMNYRGGVFIEVGAFDGIVQSNTKLFEECYGWVGILVEPSPNLFEQLCENRPNSLCFQCALGSFEQNGTYILGDFDGTLMSSVNGERLNNSHLIQVYLRSLQSILDEVGITHIDFFSLDTEGYEFNILKGIDFEKTEIDYMLIEIYIKDYVKIVTYLFDNGYEMIDSFTNYNKVSNPDWDGTHNDYLFKKIISSRKSRMGLLDVVEICTLPSLNSGIRIPLQSE